MNLEHTCTCTCLQVPNLLIGKGDAIIGCDVVRFGLN